MLFETAFGNAGRERLTARWG